MTKVRLKKVFILSFLLVGLSFYTANATNNFEYPNSIIVQMDLPAKAVATKTGSFFKSSNETNQKYINTANIGNTAGSRVDIKVRILQTNTTAGMPDYITVKSGQTISNFSNVKDATFYTMHLKAAKSYNYTVFTSGIWYLDGAA